jgi:glycogen debranching enzyme
MAERRLRLPPAQTAAPAELDPEGIAVLEGSTFMLSDRRGDVPEGSVGGLFHDDTRHLSKYELTLEGQRPQVLSSGSVDYYSAGFFLTNPPLDGIAEHEVSVQRHRFVGEGLHDDLMVQSHATRPLTLTLRLGFGADFADLFEVKAKSVAKRGTLTRRHDPERCRLRFDYRHDVFEASTVVELTQPGRVEGDDVVFELSLPPRGSWKTCVVVRLHRDERERIPLYECDSFASSEREAGKVLRKWQGEVPRLQTDLDLIRHVYDRSLIDLAALRLHAEVEGNEFSLPAAGLPWFMAIFGRDTLITSYQALWVGPELARGALVSLASLQGKEENDFRDEEPGKILHEIRFGELSALGLKPHRPYYGTVDATPLWLILLSEYWRFTGNDGTCHDLWPNAARALEWIDRYGDRDGDGYVEYLKRSPQGLDNQGWKDSWDGVPYADGTPARPPIALCEVQGYVYDAKLRTADLAERVWKDPELAARLRKEAADLRDRFNRDFWIEDRGGYYALGLDRDKRPIDSMTSNMGHLLWSGIVPEDRARIVARRLLSKPMFGGWGVRTLSPEDGGYNPIGYHRGTVWPHDNSLIAAGLARYGFREEANRIAMAMFEAARFTEHRLPEVFAGYDRSGTRFPVRYPTACNPQAWATAAPFLWLRVFLGFDVVDGEVRADPMVPAEVGWLRLHGIHALGTHWDVEGRGSEGLVGPTT